MTRRAILLLEAWPAQDQALWQILVRPAPSPLDEPGALSHLRPASLAAIREGYGRWVAWLTEAAPALLAEPPARRGRPERLLAWMESLERVVPMTRSFALDNALRLMMAAAPDDDWTAQGRLRAHMRRAALRHQSDRKQGRVLSSAVLLEAGLDLAGPQAEATSTPLRRMAHRRDGLMVAMLALLPLRLGSFCALELGSSVLRSGGRWVITVGGEVTKTGRDWEAPLPAVLLEPFERYLDEVRPWLLARGRTRYEGLWVGDRGQPYAANYLSRRIGQLTEALTGARVSPHLFRDAAATTLARGSPAAARLIRPLLGHADYGTAERHYIHAQAIEAGRDYAQLIGSLRQAADLRDGSSKMGEPICS